MRIAKNIYPVLRIVIVAYFTVFNICFQNSRRTIILQNSIAAPATDKRVLLLLAETVPLVRFASPL
jgi:hypothetical protein